MIKLLIRLAYFATIVIQGILGVRIVLIAINANPENDIVYWITRISDIVTAPFQGIVNSTINIWKIQIPAVLVLSLVFYIIIGIILSELLKSYRNND
ncbi:MAG: hypothetical protein ACOX0R_01955 [Candidatus Dojkabacteria bacterium]|jgi:hypothetical protein